DHSMLTAMLTAENIALGTHHDVWTVNVEEEYHEQSSTDDSPLVGARGTGRDAPVIAKEHYGPDHPINRPRDCPPQAGDPMAEPSAPAAAPDGTGGSADRTFAIGVGVVAAVGFVWRLAYILLFKRGGTEACNGELLCGDAIYYSAQ